MNYLKIVILIIINEYGFLYYLNFKNFRLRVYKGNIFFLIIDWKKDKRIFFVKGRFLNWCLDKYW